MTVIMTICLILGMLIAGLGIYTKINGFAAAAVIGGADGPTSIFVAGKLDSGSLNAFIVAGIALLAVAAILYVLKRKKQS